MPLTVRKSSALLNGRAAMISSASAGPTPGKSSSCSFVAVLMSSLPDAGVADDLTVDVGFGRPGLRKEL
jgi:hypothetical protein